MAEPLNWDELIEDLRAGEAPAMEAFVHHFHPALERVADGAIEPGMRRRFGPASIAQSVCRTFVRRAQGGQFEVADGDSLWALLCAIALTKVRERARFHLRDKRGVNREMHADATDSGAAGLIPDRAPGPAEAAMFAEELARVFSACDDWERQMVELRLQDHTQAEIAAEVGCTERTVRRVMRRLEARLRSG